MDNDDFDRKARQLYVDAARETPQAIQQRLRAAMAGQRPGRQVWQPLVAFASIAVFALGGLWLQRPMAPATNAAPRVAHATPQATEVPASAKGSQVSMTAAFDNDPEFYAWLGNDAPPIPGK